jgi:two-component sensor histidine kinase
MSSLEQFQQELLNDPALEQQFAACTDRASAIALAHTIAAERGYTLDAAEVAQMFDAPLTPLSDEELAAIGGATGSGLVIEYSSSQAMDLSPPSTIRRRGVRK